jgi:4-amino-4-deoxy-L-arabinose transferase-like glycosyltransferase
MSKNKMKTNAAEAPDSSVPPAGLSGTGRVIRSGIHHNTVVQLAALGVMMWLLRYNLIGIPLERDESAYACLGKFAMDGLAPYRDFYEMKPPFLFYAYGLLEKLFGYSHAGLHWAALFLGFVTMMGVYFAAGPLFGRAFRFPAGLVYGLLISNPYTTSVFLECELVVMAFILPGVYCLLRVLLPIGQQALTKYGEAGYLIGAGFLMAAAVLVKQSAIFFWGFAAAAVLINFFFEPRPRPWRRLLIRTGWLSAGMLVAAGICLMILDSFGVWKEFWFWNVDYVRLYAADIVSDKAWLLFSQGLNATTHGFVLYWVAGLMGLLVLWISDLSREKRLILTILALCSFAAVAPGLRFYHHYWLHFLPALALLITVLFYIASAWMARMQAGAVIRNLATGLAGLLLFVPFLINAGAWSAPNLPRIMQDIYPVGPFTEDKIVSDFIAKRIQPGEEVAVLGTETPDYVYLNRKPLTRHFYMAFLSRPMEQSKAWQQEALDALSSKKPEYAIFNFIQYSWMMREGSTKLLYENSYKWCMEQYDPIGWVFYRQHDKPEIVFGPEATQKTPPKDGTQFIMVMQRKKNLDQ